MFDSEMSQKAEAHTHKRREFRDRSDSFYVYENIVLTYPYRWHYATVNIYV